MDIGVHNCIFLDSMKRKNKKNYVVIYLTLNFFYFEFFIINTWINLYVSKNFSTYLFSKILLRWYYMIDSNNISSRILQWKYTIPETWAVPNFLFIHPVYTMLYHVIPCKIRVKETIIYFKKFYLLKFSYWQCFCTSVK